MTPRPLLRALLALTSAASAGAQVTSLPPNVTAEQVIHLEPAQRTWYLTRGGELSVFDHASGAATRVLPGRVWDISLSTKRDIAAFVKGGEAAADHAIHIVALDARTGLPSGAERRLAAAGDAPSISPDGKLVAFARDDSTGVGQSLVVMPVAGGKERVVAAAMPSSIRAIAWTPDGRTLYFGVNPPVPCVPEWSCLPLGGDQQRFGSIRRVSASGGDVTIVVPRAQNVFPGLSPDGTTLVYAAAGNARRWVVANPDGSERTTLTLQPSQVIQGWTGNATLVVGETNMMRAIRAISTIDLSRRP